MIHFFLHPETGALAACETEETANRALDRGFVEVTPEQYRAAWQERDQGRPIERAVGEPAPVKAKRSTSGALICGACWRAIDGSQPCPKCGAMWCV